MTRQGVADSLPDLGDLAVGEFAELPACPLPYRANEHLLLNVDPALLPPRNLRLPVVYGSMRVSIRFPESRGGGTMLRLHAKRTPPAALISVTSPVVPAGAP